uniref:Leucine-rich repeat-containing N-terminal plant-type domain-containing protein n=1 Tax=Oryza punctata TaxID=4537 RepID=A0A0E0LSU7_ORYPU
MAIKRTWQLWLLSLLTHAILLFTASSQSINGDDLSALLAFKSLIRNDPREVLSSWDAISNATNMTTPVFCRWTGVSCNDRRHPGRVTTLNLSDAGLAGTISQQLGNLTLLRVLDLSNNSLDGDIPASLGGCPKLRAMKLSTNHLSGTIPADLGQLTKLAVFDVGHNNLTGDIPKSLSNLTTLAKFIVERNFIHGQDLSWMGNLTSLIHFVLEGNSFTGNIPETFEYGSGSPVSMDGDIYSYGVLLLEMFTGRRPTDNFIDGIISLVDYVKMAYPNNLLEILDTNATYNGNTQDMTQLVVYPIFRLGLACCRESPSERMKMDNVVKELNAIKKTFSAHIYA